MSLLATGHSHKIIEKVIVIYSINELTTIVVKLLCSSHISVYYIIIHRVHNFTLDQNEEGK